MRTAMESIKEMIDVNTIVGEPVETHDGSVIIPVTRVLCGFAAGGSEYPIPTLQKGNENSSKESKLPFGGGSGAGVSVQPVGFLVVGNGDVRLLPIDGNTAIDRIIDLTPRILSYIQQSLISKQMKDKQEETT